MFISNHQRNTLTGPLEVHFFYIPLIYFLFEIKEKEGFYLSYLDIEVQSPALLDFMMKSHNKGGY